MKPKPYWMLIPALLLLGALQYAIAAQHGTAATTIEAQPFTSPTGTGQPAALFADVTGLAGIDAPRNGQMMDMLIGQAWGDYDNDGWLDMYLTDSAGPNRLYHNNGDGTFDRSPLSDTVALPDMMSGGALFADYDNDGWQDLYVVGRGPNALFHNDGGQAFTEVAESAGVVNDSHSKTAAWGDFDGDSYLDLYVANWACTPEECGRAVEGDKDRLYHNNGDGTFTDVSDWLGTGELRGAGFIASFADYDNDGDLDIYLVNDEFINPIGNVLWRNDGPGCDGWCFVNVSADAGANERVMGMGLAADDYDNDGDLDLYFSNAGPMVLLQNQGDGTFSNMAPVAGVDMGRESIGWGPVFFDADNDGWRDLYLALAGMTTGEAAGNPLFLNNGDSTFRRLDAESGAYDDGKTIGVAYADYDNDGRVDLLLGNAAGYRLYHNQGGEGADNHRIAVQLVGAGPVNRDAIGARVYVTTSDGQTQFQEVKNGSSMGGGNALTLYFGLGQAELRSLRVVWPDGTVQPVRNPQPDRHYTIHYATPTPFNWGAWIPAAALGVILIVGAVMSRNWRG